MSDFLKSALLKSNPSSRRNFLKVMTQTLGLSLLLKTKFALAQEKRRGAKKEDSAATGGSAQLAWPFVEPGKDTALVLAYHPNHNDAEKDPKTDKKTDKGLAWEKRYCNNCNFYKSVGKKDGSDVGTCTIFPNKLVAAVGICNSWAKKS